jgi:hypothetical protein
MSGRITRIRVKTYEVLMMRPCGTLMQRWCDQCGDRAAMLRVEEAALGGIALDAICHKASLNQFHLIETTDGSVFICLNSLLKENRDEKS